MSTIPEKYAESVKTRLLSRSSPEPMTGCWLWMGSCGNSGYGKLSIGHSQRISAHRASYALFNGPIEDNACVLHKCDVRTCVNPDHLFLGTKADNTQDMVRKGRHKCPARERTSCPRGHQYSGTNSQGRRICHQCANEASKRWNLKNRKSS